MSRPGFSWFQRRSDTARSLFRSRYADEWVGFLVLLAIVLMVVAVIEAGFLRQWLTPAERIHFVLPQSGVAGLAVGNDIEVMGVHAGEIRRLELNESGRMYAEGTLDPQFKRFLRTDSTATIRRRFVVAGASYIDLTRGQGPSLDWGFAVLRARVEPNPADMITQTVQDIRARLIPAMDNVQAITGQVKGLLGDLRAGKGTAGALLTRQETLDRVNRVLATLDATLQDVRPMGKKLNMVLTQANGALANVRNLTSGLNQSTPDIQRTLRNVSVATNEIPTLLIEAEASANSLRKLADQLRSLWILGGSGGHGKSQRLPAHEVRP